MPGITHVIYDMDGVLLDTEGFYTEVTQQIAQQHGKTLDWDTKARIMGRKPIDAASILVQSLDLPITPEDYLAQRKPLLESLFPTAKAMPGAPELTRHLHRHGIPQAIATSSPATVFALKTRQHSGWFSVFDAIIRGDHPDVKQSKPAPDIFLTAAAALNAKPSQCLVFEDALAGITAARAAGMNVVALPADVMDRRLYAEAHQIISHFDEFDPQQWGLPGR